MNKKFLSAVLFGALMVSSTGTFVSCKDYDDDIDNLQTQITANADAIKKLQDLVGQGKWVTSIAGIENGISVTMNDGTTAQILGTNGKDGNDGKPGTVVTIIDGYWAFDDVKSEYPAKGDKGDKGDDGEAAAAGHDVKLNEATGKWMVWDAEKGEYVDTKYDAQPVSAVKNTNGSWTISIKNADGTVDSIVIPATALTSIEVDNENAVSNDMTYWYGIVNSNVNWGWSGEETMEAGFYSKLQEDVRVLLNPAGVEGDAYNYTFKNSKGVEAPVKFFKTAKPYEGNALTRATSSNGLWVLPAEITKNPSTDIETLRRELYLSFKVNDGAAYRLALEASDEQGNLVRSEYTNTITLDKANATSSSWVSVNAEYYCMVGKTYYPEITNLATVGGQVYKYKLRLNQDPANLRTAAVYGATVTDDAQGYYATNESGVYNAISYDMCGVFINGETFVRTNAIRVYFTNEMTTDRNWTIDAINKEPLDATLDASAPAYIVRQLKNPTDKVFAYTYTYDLSAKVAELSATEKLVWDQAIQNGNILSMRNNIQLYADGLIGGEGEYNSTNLNWLMNRHMSWTINPSNAATDANKLTVKFYVSDSWSWITVPGDIPFANFRLGTAYQLKLYVVDPLNGNANVAEIVLPFEFTQPTLDITRMDSKFTQWSESDLLAYGPMCDANDHTMHLPLYDSFNAWKNVTPAYTQYVDNAEYYKMSFTNPANVLAWGKPAGVQVAALDNDLDYDGVYHNLHTKADKAAIDAAVATQAEISVPMTVDYKYYGVYPSGEADFNLVYASWLKHSALAVKEATYNTERGTHIVFLDNDDINFKTPKGDAFYLFDDIDANGKIVERKTKNGNSFNENEQHPFTTFNAANASTISWTGKVFTSGLFATDDPHFTAKQADGAQTAVTVAAPVVLTATSDFDLNTVTGDLTLKPASITEHATEVKIYQVPCIAAIANTLVATGIQKAYRGGMIIQLPTSIQDNQSVIVTVTLKDYWGYTNTFDITVKKLN